MKTRCWTGFDLLMLSLAFSVCRFESQGDPLIESLPLTVGNRLSQLYSTPVSYPNCFYTGLFSMQTSFGQSQARLLLPPPAPVSILSF